MDLIGGKTMYRPECGDPFTQYNGTENGKTAHVKSYCPRCDRHYHWVASIGKRKEHRVALFNEYLPAN